MKTYKSIDVLISTYGERIFDVEKVIKEPRSGVRYLICHQGLDNLFGIHPFVTRKDVKYFYLNSIGVTKSRNHLLNLSDSDVCYFCDDDIQLADDFETILRESHNSDTSSVITFRVDDENGMSRKKIISNCVTFRNVFNILSVGTIEISIKRDSLGYIRFCDYIGAGSNIPIGDEAIFLSCFLKNKQKVSYHPKVIASHPFDSSGGIPDLKTVYARGVTIRKVYGVFTGIPMLIVFLVLRRNLILNPKILPGLITFIRGFFLHQIESLKTKGKEI